VACAGSGVERTAGGRRRRDVLGLVGGARAIEAQVPAEAVKCGFSIWRKATLLPATVSTSGRHRVWVSTFLTLAGEIDALATTAGIHFRVKRYYRMLSARFPYAIYHTIEGDEVRVWRLLDCRRDPRWVSAQLKKQ
jgi:hypothetical protein